MFSTPEPLFDQAVCRRVNGARDGERARLHLYTTPTQRQGLATGGGDGLIGHLVVERQTADRNVGVQVNRRARAGAVREDCGIARAGHRVIPIARNTPVGAVRALPSERLGRGVDAIDSGLADVFNLVGGQGVGVNRHVIHAALVITTAVQDRNQTAPHSMLLLHGQGY